MTILKDYWSGEGAGLDNSITLAVLSVLQGPLKTFYDNQVSRLAKDLTFQVSLR